MTELEFSEKSISLTVKKIRAIRRLIATDENSISFKKLLWTCKLCLFHSIFSRQNKLTMENYMP